MYQNLYLFQLLRFRYISDLEDKYVDDFEDLSWLYTLPDYSIHDSRSLLTLNIMICLGNLIDYTWYLPDTIVHVT